ncbi:dTDP-glucose 4,6-dehydratase [Saprolegnia diclina VS20]|uniref:dTDP-glucose 4,6-dehydratase n=1 Tax=Saprolegnia diclina (strain VS20) TaxID=1156394 RepID=T0SE69_SAPDV|nr:dTDP-glucose 4,6-dehydratase [Saprolegnia diclina VS20]EQC41187.1 dTDP-glucose 4,6-dehydratase [Saprolegnia diclina VS20]|eukprot:XP_008604901.1 dTDP-glucose 4,6-dehydratase [Saprolegnia diclina VS20]
MHLLVTGGVGFIGANFVHFMLAKYPSYRIVVLDKLTYAGNLANLAAATADPRFAFVQGDIADATIVEATMTAHAIDVVVNFAAETHVDRSILNADAFVQTNVLGTYVLLEAAKRHRIARFHHISTDEVYGHVPDGCSSLETDKLDPRSPYAASKASADLLVLSYFTTFGLPVTITRGSNNIGPYQHLEKVVPLFTTNALEDLPLPVYGDGLQQREYQHVHDHCEAIDLVLHTGALGEIYNAGAGETLDNLSMLRLILQTLRKPESLIRHVTDRPGHDRRYSVNIEKIAALGWRPRHSPQEAIVASVQWYVANESWWRPVKDGEFQAYYQLQYGDRLSSS